MIVTAVIGLMLGVFVPAIASRFGKILPADPGLVLLELWHKPCLTKSKNPAQNLKLKKMWRKFYLISAVWGVVVSGLFILNSYLFTGTLFYFACAFIYMVSLLMSVDRMYYLLPDFFTIPLLVLGLTMVAFKQAPLTLTESLVGAWYGYLVSVIAVVMMGLFKKSEFGAGDAKMLTALGAWLGLIGLSITLVLSFVFFLIEAIVHKRSVGPFGPALGSAAIIVFILLNLK